MQALAIIHTALNTSLGLDVQTSAAGARAGLIRSQEADNFPIGKPAVDEVESAIIHPLPFITAGFQDQARLGVILQKTLSDICKQVNRDKVNVPIDLYFSLPHPHRTNQGLALQTDEPSTEQSELENLLNTEEPDETVYRATLNQSINDLPWPVAPTTKALFFSGSTGVSECIDAVSAKVETRNKNGASDEPDTLAVIVAVDSLVSIKELQWLHACNRLKHSGNPVGVQPGEAGSAITVCSAALASKLGLKAQGNIQTCIIENSPTSQLKAQLSDGKVLAKVLDKLLPVTDNDTIFKAWVVSDHNGEDLRASEWGGALHFLKKHQPNVLVNDTWFPIISFGYTEAAYGAISIVLICEAFNRGYAPSSYGYVVASADGILRSGMTITLANGRTT